MNYKLSKSEIKEIKQHGLSEKEISEQIGYILSGTKKPRLLRPATINNGIHPLGKSEINELIKEFRDKKQHFTFTKFVPASGAATRMFKILSNLYFNYNSLTLSELKKLSEKNFDFAKAVRFFDKLNTFPFAGYIDKKFTINEKTDIIPILRFILTKEGLNFLDSPKALIPFHRAGNSIHSPVHEHLNEASKLFGIPTNIHFTISEKYLHKFKSAINTYYNEHKLTEKELSVSYSFQLGKTDTIALDENNNLVKESNGKILFRPAGHGALIENLNKIDSDFIYINNIDNVAHFHRQEEIIVCKQALSGFAIKLRETIHSYLSLLEKKDISVEKVYEIKHFVSEFLYYKINSVHLSERENLFNLLNRPFRIAAMVKNEGEPGGGPFWITENGGTSLQIIEKAQIDFSDPLQVEIANASTHFNPVDLICSVKNHHGEKYNLMNFINPELGIVTRKSYNGKEIKVLEQPGLWNGAMHNWLTIFVELPLFTFNPVKEINDLLKEFHQPVKN